LAIYIIDRWDLTSVFKRLKKLKRRNSKGSAKQEGESGLPSAWQRQPAHRSAHKEGNFNKGGGLSFLIVPTVTINHTPRNPFFGRDETRRAWRTPKPQTNVLRDRHIASQAKLENVCWYRDFVKTQPHLFKRRTHDVCKFQYNCNYSIWKQLGGSISVPPLLFKATQPLTFSVVRYCKNG